MPTNAEAPIRLTISGERPSWGVSPANALPRETVEVFDLAQAGELDGAWELYRRLLPLFRYDSAPLLVQAIKYAMELVGKPAGKTRPPRLPLGDEDRKAVEKAFAHFAATKTTG